MPLSDEHGYGCNVCIMRPVKYFVMYVVCAQTANLRANFIHARTNMLSDKCAKYNCMYAYAYIFIIRNL